MIQPCRDAPPDCRLLTSITLAGVRTVVGLAAGPAARSERSKPRNGSARCCPRRAARGVFLEAARLVGSFAFGTLGAHRLECARAAAERPRERRAAQAGRRRRKACSVVRSAGATSTLDQVLWSMLKEDWGEPVDVRPRRGCTEPCGTCRRSAASMSDAGRPRRGALFLGAACRTSDFDQPLLLLSLCRAVVAAGGAQGLRCRSPTSGSTMSVSYAVDFASLLLLGPHETMLVAAPARSVSASLNRKEQNPLHRTLFSMASLVVTVQGAGLAFRLLGDPARRSARPTMRRPLVGAATVYFLLNTGLVADGDRAVDARTDRRRSGRRTSSGARPATSSAPAPPRSRRGSSTHAGYWLARADVRAALSDLPHLQGLHGPHRGRAAARAADLGPAPGDHRGAGARDRRQGSDDAAAHPPRAALRGRSGEGRRPAADSEIQGVKTAALLHDIGKLAVPEHILSKPGPLTQEEFQKIRIHPQVGAEIIAAVPFPYPVAPLILSHHERWDGKGYPHGLAGERHSDRRAHPDHRRLLRRGHDRASVSQGAEPRERGRRCCGTRPDARSIRTLVPHLHRAAAGADGRGR